MRWLGAGFILYYCILAAARLSSGLAHNLLWASNVTMVLAGVGLFFENRKVITAALLIVFVPHLLWIVDFFMTQFGFSPMGIANYVVLSDVSTWILTLHHFVLVPVLLYAIYRYGAAPESWPIAAGYFAITTGLTVLFTNPAYNINCAFEVCSVTGLEQLSFLNELPLFVYWLVQNVAVTVVLYVPLNRIIWRLAPIRES